MELDNKHGTQVPSSLLEVGTRIGEVCDLFRYRKDAAKKADISTDQLARYIDGTSPRLGFIPIARLCVAAGVSMEWVWSGKGEMMLNTDQVQEEMATYNVQNGATYLQALKLCEEVLQSKNVDLKPDKKVELVKIVAGMIEKEEESEVKSNIYQLVQLAS